MHRHGTLSCRVCQICAAAVTVASISFVVNSALGAPSVRVPVDCGSQSEFESELRLRLGSHAAAVLPPTDVAIEAGATTFHLSMRVGSERRELSDASCRDLFLAAVVIAASLAETELAATEPEQRAQPSTTEPPPTRAEQPPRASFETPAPPQAPRARRGSAARAVFAGDVALGATVGLLPRAAFSPRLGVGLELGRFGAVASVRWLPPVGAQDASGRGVSAWALGAHVGLMWRPIDLVRAGVGVVTYRLHGTGLGSTETRSAAVWAAGPLVEATLIPLNRNGTWAGVGGELQAELVRPVFEIIQYREIFRVSPLVGSVFFRFGHRFE